MRGAGVSTRIKGADIQVRVDAYAMLHAEPARLKLQVREGPPGTWRWNLSDGIKHRAAGGRIAEIPSHLDALRYAATLCAPGFEPGTVERALLEQFAADV
jgi:hypothetical protein